MEPTAKTCRKCGETKLLAAFSQKKGGKLGLRESCRTCQRAYDASRYSADKLAKSVAYRRANPEVGLAYREANRERLNAISAARRRMLRTGSSSPILRTKMSPEVRREKQREWTRRYDEKKRATPRGRLENSVAAGIAGCLARGSKAGRKWQTLVGYSVDELMVHLEKLFLPGMTFDNYGEWHVDHVIPKSAFNYESPEHIDFRRAWALSNLQPLWAVDNIKKRARLKSPFQPSLAI